MSNNQKKEFISVSDSKINFESWIEKPFIPDELKSNLRASELLIVPTESIRDIKGPVFPTGTEDLYLHLKETMPSFNPEICICDDEYKEYAFHGILLILGTFVVTAVAAPIFVNIVSEYVKKKIFKSGDKNSDTEVRFEMTVTLSDGTSKKIKYDGPASQFQTLIDKQMSALPVPIELKAEKNDDSSRN